ncbi:hypothetical protein [Parabacteroides sp. Marseille-P3160]|uniref:hypothetical protein n=1 Tax=Parabacteroides sp. Marseille-P3160 TaxID=1917887 RepID=UPI0009B948D1|nr:hypothetical protein [Parabacteroides sp. Marseille-P3160]
MTKEARTLLYNISGLFILAGAVLYFIQWTYAPYLFALGAAGMTVSFLTAPYKELDFRQRRFYRYNLFSGVLMIVASAIMFKGHKAWIVFLTISAIYQLYFAFRAPKE